MTDVESLPLADGHIAPIWRWVAAHGDEHTGPTDPLHPLGPFGECWSNAWLALQRGLGRRVRYVEGVVWVPGEGCRIIDASTGQHVKRGVLYPHAWLLDLRTGCAWEATHGYESVRRIGVPLDSAVVARTFAPYLRAQEGLRKAPELASALELAGVMQMASPMDLVDPGWAS